MEQLNQSIEYIKNDPHFDLNDANRLIYFTTNIRDRIKLIQKKFVYHLIIKNMILFTHHVS